MYSVKIILAHPSQTQLKLIEEVIKTQSLKIEVVGSVSDLDSLYDAIIRHMPDLVILPEGFFTPCINTITDLCDVICITENRSYREAGNIRYAFVPVQPPELIDLIQKIYKEQDETTFKNKEERRQAFFKSIQFPQHYCSAIDTFCFDNGLTKTRGVSPFNQRKEILSMITSGELPLERTKEHHPGTRFNAEQTYDSSIKQIIDNIEEQEQQREFMQRRMQHYTAKNQSRQHSQEQIQQKQHQQTHPEIPSTEEENATTENRESLTSNKEPQETAEKRNMNQGYLEFFREPKTNYVTGERIQKKNLLVKHIEPNGSFEVIRDFEFEPNRPLNINDTEITIKAKGLHLSLPITVVDKAIVGVVISSMPQKTTYIKGARELDLTGGMLSVFYTDNTSEAVPITKDMIKSFDSETIGQQVVYMQHAGQELPIQITVEDRKLTKVFIKTPPLKHDYVDGELIDTTGMELMGEYDNGEQELISDFECPEIRAEKGQAVVKLTYKSQMFPLFIHVNEYKVTGIRMAQLPTQQTYLEYRDMLDITGGMVAKILNNGQEQIIPLEQRMVSGFNNQKTGKCKITVRVDQFQCSYEVDIVSREAVALEIIHMPNKTTYFECETFDPAGLEIKVKYNNNTTEIATEYTITPEVLQATTESVTVHCEGLSLKIPVVMQSRIVEEISIAKMPDILSFKEGVDKIDTSGGRILVLYNNNDVETIEMQNEMIEGFDNTIPGENTISIRYHNAITKYNIMIIPKILVGLMITNPPKRTIYYEGEEFNTEGLTVMGFFDTGKMEEIKGYSFSPMNSLTKETNAIVISYIDKSAIVPIVVTDKPEPELEPKTELTIGSTSDLMSILRSGTERSGTEQSEPIPTQEKIETVPEKIETTTLTEREINLTLTEQTINPTQALSRFQSTEEQNTPAKQEKKFKKFYAKTTNLRFKDDTKNASMFF